MLSRDNYISFSRRIQFSTVKSSKWLYSRSAHPEKSRSGSQEKIIDPQDRSRMKSFKVAK